MEMVKDPIYRYDGFKDGKVLHDKKKNHLPAMGWNSWNAFGSGNTEALTKDMADAIVALGLDKLGYKYVVLDDGCYKPERVDGKLSNEEVKFPSGFKALSQYVHDKGLKFGMYNDIGTNLCAGAAVGTCGHEKVDAKTYLDWGVDFLKVDNCYYLWDNATFSDPTNAKYVYAPNIKAIRLELVVEEDPRSGKAGCDNVEEGAPRNRKAGCDQADERCISVEYSAVNDGIITGSRAEKTEDYVTKIGTFDGTGPEHTPVGLESSELHFEVSVPGGAVLGDAEVSVPIVTEDAKVSVPLNGTYNLYVCYATGEEEGVGSWLQVAVDREQNVTIDEKACDCSNEEQAIDSLVFDDFLKATEGPEMFVWSEPNKVKLTEGKNTIRLMNHRRQENTLGSYGTLLKELNEQAPDNDIIFSACEWGKTQPQNWAYKVADSWRILNDITFQVGADGDPGNGQWFSDYTTSVTVQYNKAVIMDEFSGLDKGWNDPDMLMVGMNGLDMTMCKSHMTMWCMMNSPLMLGLDLRRVKVGDEIYKIIANEKVIQLNQDSLGVQAKRIFSTTGTDTVVEGDPRSGGVGCDQYIGYDKAYITDPDRVDILAKPLSDGSVAISFFNISQSKMTGPFSVTKDQIISGIGNKMVGCDLFKNAESFEIENLWTGEKWTSNDQFFEVKELEACDNVTIKVVPK